MSEAMKISEARGPIVTVDKVSDSLKAGDVIAKVPDGGALVTDLWFTGLLRRMVWQNVAMLSWMIAFTWLTTYPIRHLPTAKPLSWGWYAMWYGAAGVAVIATWRWIHWHHVMKANIVR